MPDDLSSSRTTTTADTGHHTNVHTTHTTAASTRYLPPPHPQVDALLGLNLATPSPMICLLADGRLLALTGYQALLHVAPVRT